MKKISIVLYALVVGFHVCAMEPHKDKPLRIMTFNVRRAGKEKEPQKEWINRKQLVTQVITTAHSDVVGLQEPIIEQIQDIAKDLGGDYAWIGQGRGREWWGFSEDEYNPLFYNTKRLELLDSGTFVLNPSGFLNWRFLWSPTTIGLLTRISTWGKFRDKVTGEELYVYNTHLDHAFAAAQVYGMQAICKKMGERTDTLPVILMGDFNTELTPTLLNSELKDFNNSKSRAQSRIGPSQTRTGWHFDQLKEIDHILINKQAPIVVQQHVVVQEESREQQPSDHRPVFVDVMFAKTK